MKRRRGYTLIEAISAIAMVGTVMGSLSLGLHRMFLAQRRISDNFVLVSDMDRLARQLRTDAHAADMASVDGRADEEDADEGNDVCLALTLNAGGQVEYRIQENRIVRLLQQAGDVVHRETYRLSPAARAAWEVSGEQPAKIISLVLTPIPQEDPRTTASVVIRRVDAALGVIPGIVTSSEGGVVE